MRLMAFSRTPRRPMRLAAWLAMAAIAFNALWPLIASARPADVPSLTEICTALGVKVVTDDTGLPGTDPATRHHQPHCPLCTFGADKLVAPPSTPWQLAAVTATHAGVLLPPVPPLAPDALRTPAQPRAPPLWS